MGSILIHEEARIALSRFLLKQLNKPDEISMKEWLLLRGGFQVELTFDTVAILCDEYTTHRIMDLLQTRPKTQRLAIV